MTSNCTAYVNILPEDFTNSFCPFGFDSGTAGDQFSYHSTQLHKKKQLICKLSIFIGTQFLSFCNDLRKEIMEMNGNIMTIFETTDFHAIHSRIPQFGKSLQ